MRDRSVIARSGAGLRSRGDAFSFDLRGPQGGVTGGELALDPSVSYFAPGETKRQVFDFMIGNNLQARALPVGTYTVRGAFAGRWVEAPSIELTP